MNKIVDSVDIISEDMFELSIKRNSVDDFFVSLKDLQTDSVLFDNKCNTFTTGNFIFHLEKAIVRYEKNHNTILMSRWSPKVHNRFLNNLDLETYITTRLYRHGTIDKVRFKVKFDNKDSKYEKTIVYFECTLNEIKKLIN